MTDAIVFVQTQHLLRDAALCIEYCRNQGYNMVGVVKDDWKEAMRMGNAGQAGVIVAADAQHLDPKRRPRVEIVAEQPVSDRETRTRIIRRNGVKGL